MTDIPDLFVPSNTTPKDERIAIALETIAQTQIAQAEDLRKILEQVTLIAAKIR